MTILPWFLLAWIAGIVTAIAARWICDRVIAHHERRQVEFVRRMNESIVAKNYGRSEIERRRALKQFNRTHGNAEVVTLTGDGPRAA